MFQIDYIEDSSKELQNSYFPSIYIKSIDKVDAWLQIIRTDSIEEKLKILIDSADKKKYPEIYPFYCLGNSFYDAPRWELF